MSVSPTPSDEFNVPMLRPATRISELFANPFRHSAKVEVEYFANEKSLKQRLNVFFFKNQRSSLCLRIIIVLIKVLACICYTIRVCLDPGPDAAKCYGCPEINLTDVDSIDKSAYLEKPTINYLALVWVIRPYPLWLIQIILSALSLIRTGLYIFLTYKGNIVQPLIHPFFLLECLTSIPFLITLSSPALRNLFVPMFLNCWIAKLVLENLLNDLHRAIQKSQSAVVQQLTILGSTLICLVYTAACGIQHIQRAGRSNMTLFQSFYFSIVTFSTVGYGEFYPDIWISQMLVIVMICVTFMVIPKQCEQLLLVWMEKQKAGGEYSMHRAKSEKHVVLCTTILRSDTMYDFLNEFYAHPLLQDYFVLLLSPNDLDNSMKMLLQVPLWSQRVIYMKGAALKDADLERVRLTEADGCFLLANKDVDKTFADQQTILRSWAVRDFAPKCPQYIQIYRPENKMHVKHAEYVVCEDEFKYAMLANNCICPGISTLVTLLLHTSRGEEGQESEEEWHRIYGRHSGNEIYHIKVSQSKLLSEFVGKSFTYASFHAHRKYGVGLLAVQKDKIGSTIQLNPGSKHTLRGTDICYYMSITEEEQMTLLTKEQSKRRSSFSHVATTIAGIGTVAMELQENETGGNAANSLGPEQNNGPRRPSIGVVPEVAPTVHTPQQTSEDQLSEIKPGTVCPVCKLECQEREYIRGFPPVTPYVGTSATLCHLMKKKKPLCCLQLAQVCSHCSFTTADQYKWKNPAIMLVSDHASNGIYNFIIPLRAHYRSSHTLNPIILLLKEPPQNAFLDTISFFPQIYWMVGNIESIDNLLRAGILLSQHVIVVNKELGNRAEDDYLADAGTIVTVQTISRFFPQIRIFTELSLATNMRFMQFNAKDIYALHQSKIEKIEKDRGSHIAFMFRLPFAAGNVFSATMLDTLLYQAFVKTYLIQIVRLLLGIDQAFGSGYLSSVEIREEDLWLRNYGRLYQKFCSTDGDVPIGLFRTQRTDSTQFASELGTKNPDMQELLRRKFSCKYLVSERHEVENLVRNRLLNLGLEEAAQNYKCEHEKRDSISYVIINPSAELKLEAGDIVYVIKPNSPFIRAGITPSPMPRRKSTKDGSKTSPTGLTTGGKDVIGRLSPNNDQSVPKLTITFSSPNHDHQGDSSLCNSADECEPEVQPEFTVENETEPLNKSGPKIIKFLKR